MAIIILVNKGELNENTVFCNNGSTYTAEGMERNMSDLIDRQPDIEKICARIKAEAIKHNVEYMKHGDRYMLGFVDGMRLARCIVDGTIDDPAYFTLSGEKKDG